MDIFSAFEVLNSESANIMEAKNHDYRAGTGDPFANFRMSTLIGIKPKKGIMLRMLDKHARIRTFIAKGTLKVKGESVMDALLDCFNYTILCHGMDNEAGDYDGLLKCRHQLVTSTKTILTDMSADVLDILTVQEEHMAEYSDNYKHWLHRYAAMGVRLL